MNQLQKKILDEFSGPIDGLLNTALDKVEQDAWATVPNPLHHAPGLLEANRPIVFEFDDNREGEPAKLALTRGAYLDALILTAVENFLNSYDGVDADVVLQRALFGRVRYE